MRRTTVAFVLALIALAPACGRKSRPLPPEAVQPEAPGDLTAIAVPEGVRLSFTRPTHYTGGRKMNDLGKLVVERAPGEGEAPKFEKVGELLLEDRDRFRQDRRLSWVDATATAGTRYLYRVTAVTLDRYKSQPAGPVAVRFGPPAPAAAEDKGVPTQGVGSGAKEPAP